ncbi:MAG: hypothetical protein Q8R24_07960 [Legionellaceae bacterium]|nr:hypothetical protein [Legionellaceae bacterium]
MPKELRFGDKARQEMLAGVNALAAAHQLANGPRGRNIVLEKSYGAPTVVKYGNPELPFFNKTNLGIYKKTESNALDPLEKTAASAPMK